MLFTNFVKWFFKSSVSWEHWIWSSSAVRYGIVKRNLAGIMTTMMMTKTTTATKKTMLLMIMMVNSQERYFHRSLVPCSENPLNGKMLDAKANGEVDCFSALPSIKIFCYSTPLDAETCRFIISRKKGLVTFDYIFFSSFIWKGLQHSAETVKIYSHHSFTKISWSQCI